MFSPLRTIEYIGFEFSFFVIFLYFILTFCTFYVFFYNPFGLLATYLSTLQNLYNKKIAFNYHCPPLNNYEDDKLNCKFIFPSSNNNSHHNYNTYESFYHCVSFEFNRCVEHYEDVDRSSYRFNAKGHRQTLYVMYSTSATIPFRYTHLIRNLFLIKKVELSVCLKLMIY